MCVQRDSMMQFSCCGGMTLYCIALRTIQTSALLYKFHLLVCVYVRAFVRQTSLWNNFRKIWLLHFVSMFDFVTFTSYMNIQYQYYGTILLTYTCMFGILDSSIWIKSWKKSWIPLFLPPSLPPLSRSHIFTLFSSITSLFPCHSAYDLRNTRAHFSICSHFSV